MEAAHSIHTGYEYGHSIPAPYIYIATIALNLAGYERTYYAVVSQASRPKDGLNKFVRGEEEGSRGWIPDYSGMMDGMGITEESGDDDLL